MRTLAYFASMMRIMTIFKHLGQRAAFALATEKWQ
ncbi:hypothetical protein PSO31014_00762 [Pandoraea soli]|uniref:Integrase n=1 Tax=Pandoraea soli TaxID=2508293 RepID=A0ABY6VXA9_9BURK|nr:hypothetical protein PSO31014_00762 [Pandoraea soli]